MEWVALYKLARLGALALILVGIAVYLYTGNDPERFERPAKRMMEEDDAA
jgi:hypothetical protein